MRGASPEGAGCTSTHNDITEVTTPRSQAHGTHGEDGGADMTAVMKKGDGDDDITSLRNFGTENAQQSPK